MFNSMEPLVLYALFIICTSVYIIFHFLYYLYSTSILTKKFPPGPISFPIIGNSYLLKQYSIKHGGLHKAFSALCKLYNTDILGLTLGGSYVVIIQNYELLEEALSKDELLGRPNTFFIRLRSMGTNKGITMTDGHIWHEQRTFAMKQLHCLGFGKETMESLILNEIQNLLNKIPNDGSSVSLKVAISRCVINVLWALVTGSSFEKEELLDELLMLMNKRSKAFDMAGGIISQFPWIRFIAPEASGYNLIVRLNNKLKNIISGTIESHKATYSKHKTRDFIDAFLHEMYDLNNDKSTFTEDQLLMVCLDFFIAGSLTTSSEIDFLLLQMLVNPDVQQIVYEEISGALKPGQLSSLSLKEKMPYVRGVILENERMFPVTPTIGPRRVLKETILGGYTIPKDTIILMNISPLSSDEKIWVNPNKFIPIRFVNNHFKEEKKKLFSFGKGKRRCPGEKLAKSFIFLFFTSFLNTFQLLNADDNLNKINCVPGMILSPKPYKVKLIPRHNL